jgi:hypothetical protein
VNRGEGTAGKFVSDPSVYESVNDILIGINESKLLRWLIRNRQEKGIEKRYNTESSKPPGADAPPPVVKPVPKPTPKTDAPAPDVPAVAPTSTATTTAGTTTTSTAPPM